MKRFATAIIAVIFALPVWGQSSQTGLPPFGTFQNGRFDNVNLNNLNVQFSIPLFSVPGRGLGLSGSISYNSDFWIVPMPCFGCYSQWGAWSDGTSPGWTTNNFIAKLSYQLTGYTCSKDNTDTTEYSNFQVTEPNGTVHLFTADYFTPKTSCPGYQTDIETSLATDSSGWYVDGKNFKAYSPSGVALNSSIGYYETDPNGNYIHTTSTGYTDTSNRTVTVSSSSTVQTYTLKDSNGNNQTFTLNLQQFTIQTNFGCSGVLEAGPYSQYLPVSLVLPNGQTYTFHYESTPGYPNSTTGRISEVDLPTGGKYQYSYGSMDCTYGTPTSLTRTITNGTSVATWQYSRSETDVNNMLTTTVTITAPQMPYDSAANQRVVIFATGQPCNYTPPTCMIETDKYYQGSSASGTLLKTVQTIFQEQNVNEKVGASTPAMTTITLGNDQVSQAATTYDNQGRLLEQDDYDWGNGSPGSPLRKVINTYLNSQTYIDIGLSNRLASTVLQNGSGTTVAQSQYEYDNYTQGLVASGAVQHNSSFGTGYTTRGNVTAVERWRNTDNSWLTTRFQFDDAGNILSATDPNSHTTSTSFGDSWANSACAPAGGSAAAYPTTATNALGQTEMLKYNSCTGTVASTTDANNQSTSYSYDEMSRTTQITYPDTGQTSYTYNDTAPPSMTTTTKINSTQNLSTTTLFDNLGEVHETQQGDPEGTDYADTTYDAIGRVYTVSNPYRTTSDATYGNTTYQYDALSRPTHVIDQDGSEVSSSYSGNCTTVTDEAGKATKSCSDELSRLNRVFEDPSGLNYETDYSYDAIGDLIGVLQGGRQFCQVNSVSYSRCFTHDSLGEVTQSSNPESGTTSYVYDAAGRLTSKTAPAPNQTGSGTVTVTYGYDALNRLASEYINGTISSWYAYDQSSVWGYTLGNPIGRLTSAGQSTYNSEYVFSYDPLGRVQHQWECTPSNCGTSNWETSAAYDLTGDVTSVTNPAGKQISYAYDNAANVVNMTSNYVDSTHPATLWTADSIQGYYPNGAVEKATFANGLTEANLYDPRLQPCRMDVDSSATLLTTCDDTLPSGNVQHFHYTYGSWGSTNNGDTTNLVAMGAQNFNRTYTYDSLDRLSTMAAPGDACSGLSWNYDEWGNRTDQNDVSGTCGTFHATVGTNNQFGSPYQYDAAGNMTYDGTHSYTYDADGHVSAVDGGATASYAYDAYGRRVRKSAGGVITNYVYGPLGAVVAEYGSCQTCWAVGYMYLNGRLKAEYTNSTTYFVHSDVLGSTRLVTGYPTPSIADCDDYYPFGELIACGGTTTLRYKFTGQERDNETLLDNFKARYVASAMGRFMNPDPSGISLADLTDPQQLNLYSYTRNNPVNTTDPTGLCGIEGDEYPCGLGDNCWDFDVMSCWHDFAPAPELPILPPLAANPASSFIATGPGTDWQTILFGPPTLSQFAINNFHTVCTTSFCGIVGDYNGEQLCNSDGGHCQNLWWDSSLQLWNNRIPDPLLVMDIFHCPGCANTWNQLDCTINGSLETTASSTAEGTAISAVTAGINSGSGSFWTGAWGAAKEGTVSTGALIATYGITMARIGWRMVRGCHE